MIKGNVYGCSELQKFPLKIRFLEIHDKNYIKDQQLKVKNKDGREAPWKPSTFTDTFLLLKYQKLFRKNTVLQR